MSGPFSPEATVPDVLSTERFALRPLRVADAERDHAAVMQTRSELLGWEQNGWPAEDFTVDDNRADLVELETRHDAHRAFTYTLTDLGDSEALGCVYLFPPDATFLGRATIISVDGGRWDELDVVVYFWVRAGCEGIEADLVAELRTWLATSWRVGATVFVASTLFPRQIELLRSAGLSARFEVREPGKVAPYLAFG